jgi:hypothetical protein
VLETAVTSCRLASEQKVVWENACSCVAGTADGRRFCEDDLGFFSVLETAVTSCGLASEQKVVWENACSCVAGTADGRRFFKGGGGAESRLRECSVQGCHHGGEGEG